MSGGYQPKPSNGQDGPPNCGSGGFKGAAALMEDGLTRSREAAKEEGDFTRSPEGPKAPEGTKEKGVLTVPVHLRVFVSLCEEEQARPRIKSGVTREANASGGLVFTAPDRLAPRCGCGTDMEWIFTTPVGWRVECRNCDPRPFLRATEDENAPGDGPAKQAQVGTPLEPTASPASAGGAFSAEDVALIHALRAGSERVTVHAGQDRPVVLKGRLGHYGQPSLDHLTGPEALALGLALVRAAMAVQP